MRNGIIFQVETSRVLQILTREIYDLAPSLDPRESAERLRRRSMRFARSGTLEEGGRIDIRVGERRDSNRG